MFQGFHVGHAIAQTRASGNARCLSKIEYPPQGSGIGIEITLYSVEIL